MADDDEEERLFFKKSLSAAKLNVDVTVAKNGFQLMKRLAVAVKNFPDVIFLDSNMPHQNGRQCLREIRRDKKFHKVPIVMLSESVNEKEIAETFIEGANLYVDKQSFFEDPVKRLRQIFTPNWQQGLLNRDKKKFVLITESRKENQL